MYKVVDTKKLAIGDLLYHPETKAITEHYAIIIRLDTDNIWLKYPDDYDEFCVHRTDFVSDANYWMIP